MPEAAAESRFNRHFVPGLVMRSVLVGATYSTGREVTEFFLKFGAFSGLVGLVLATALFSLFCIIALELARRYQVLDYRSFSRLYMGRLWFLYELGFVFGVMLTLSTIAAAAAEMGSDLLHLPPIACSLLLMAAIAALVFAGSGKLEKIMALWSMFFYAAYAVLLVMALFAFRNQIVTAFRPMPLSGGAMVSAVIYAGFSCSILPIVIFVARHMRTPSDSIISGALSGPLVFLPGLALLIILTPFMPGIVDAPVPVMTVLNSLGLAWLVTLIKVAILGELSLNGAGLLHGVNERVANEVAERGRKLPWLVRPVLAAAALVFSVYLADAVGLIQLVSLGFRYGALLFLIVMVLPIITRGVWMLLPRKKRARRKAETVSAREDPDAA
jgi:uncharacterized membrane protein YkvI